MPNSPSPILATEDLHRDFRDGLKTLQILQGVNVSVDQGQWLALLGQSGSGKSTLLHLMGGLDRPTSGRVLFEGRPLFPSSARELDRYRSRSVGFVFQFYHLLPELNAVENVMVGAMIGRGLGKWFGDRAAVRKRATDLLDSFGLGERLNHRPNKLSGGERQRVAIARALINEPAVLLADEPTGNLDAETGELILNVFRKLHQAGQTIVMVTHDQHIADAADKQMVLSKGKLHVDR